MAGPSPTRPEPVVTPAPSTGVDLAPSLLTALRDARRVCVLTGAGVSAESGVPTFREAQTGLWAKYDPMALATPEAFDNDPQLVWRWYRWRRDLVARAEPNAGHYALASLAERLPELTLVTQNVDGLHQRAGSRDVIEFHGSLFADVCSARRCHFDPAAVRDAELPACPTCGALLRPGVVWFGEAIPERANAAAFEAAAACDVFFSIGTSSLVYPAAGLISVARDNGALSVEINPNETPASASVDLSIRGTSAGVLPALLEAL